MNRRKESIFAYENISHEPLKEISEVEFIFDKYAKIILPEYRAEYWNYFGHPADSNGNILTCRIAICIFCHIKLRTSNSNSIRQHLQKHHPKEYSSNIPSDYLKDLKIPVEKLSNKDLRSYRDKAMNSLKFDKILTLEDIRRHPIYRFFGYPADSDGNILSHEILYCTVCKKGLANNTTPTTVIKHLKCLHLKIYVNLIKKKSQGVKRKRAERIDKIARELNGVPNDSLKTLPTAILNDDNTKLEFDYVIVSDVARSIWQYFGYPADKNKEMITDKVVICIFCKKEYQKFSVGSIKKHFKSAHFNLVNKPLDELISLAKVPVITVNPNTLRNYRTVKLQSINYTQILTLEEHKTHRIYKYFGFPADSGANIIATDIIICNICKRIFYRSHKSYNLLQHIKKFHTDVYKKTELKTFKIKKNSIQENDFSNDEKNFSSEENNFSIEENNFSIEEDNFSIEENKFSIGKNYNLSDSVPKALSTKILKPKLKKPDKNSIWNWFGFPADKESKIITKNIILCTICFEAIHFTKYSRNIYAFKHLEEMHNIECENQLLKTDALKFNNIQMNNQLKFSKVLKPKISHLNSNSLWNWFGFPGTEDSKIARKDIIICSFCYKIFDYDVGCKPSKAIKHLENFHKIIENTNHDDNDNIEIKECEETKLNNFGTQDHKQKDLFLEIDNFFCTTIKSINKSNRTFFVKDTEFLLTKNIKKVEKLLKTSLNVNISSYTNIISKLTNYLNYCLCYEIWNNIDKIQYVSIYLNFINKANLKWYPLLSLKLQSNNCDKIFKKLNLNNCSAVITNSRNETIDRIFVQESIPVVMCLRSLIENCLSKIFELPVLSRAIKEISRCNKINISNYTSNWSIFDLLKNFRNLDNNSKLDFTEEISSVVAILTPLKNTIENLNKKSELLLSDGKTISDNLLENYEIDDFHDTVLHKNIKEIVNQEFFIKILENDYLQIASLFNPKAIKLLNEADVQDILHKKLNPKNYLKNDFSNYLAHLDLTSGYMTLEWWYHNKNKYSNEFLQLVESYNCIPLYCNSFLPPNYENQFHVKRHNLREYINETLFLHYLNLHKNDYDDTSIFNQDKNKSFNQKKNASKKNSCKKSDYSSNDKDKTTTASSLKRKINKTKTYYFDGSESDFSNDLDKDFEIENEIDQYSTNDYDSDDGNKSKKQQHKFQEFKNKTTLKPTTKLNTPVVRCKRIKLNIDRSEDKIETKFPKLDTIVEIQKLEKDLRENPALKEEYINYVKSEWQKTRESPLGYNDILTNIMSDKLVFILYSMEFEHFQSHNISFYKFIKNYSTLYDCFYVSSELNDEKNFDTYLRNALTKARRRYVQRRNKVEKTLIEKNKKVNKM